MVKEFFSYISSSDEEIALNKTYGIKKHLKVINKLKRLSDNPAKITFSTFLI